MERKRMQKVLSAVLALCMMVPLMMQDASAAERSYLEVSITDGKTTITDTSSKYLTEESPLLAEIAQIVNGSKKELAKEFQSPAMSQLMDDGLRAKNSQSRWNAYLAKMEKHLKDSSGVVEILKDVDCTLGQLSLGRKYVVSYENTVQKDRGFGKTYQVTLSRHIDGDALYDDVPREHWAFDTVTVVSTRGLFNGVAVRKFAPETPMTRQMLMTVLARMDGADTSGTPYAKGMAWAVAKGVSDGSNPTREITRQQLVAMLYRYIGSPAVEGDLNRFADAGLVAEYAQSAMVWAVENNIVAGKADGRLDPFGSATRAQVATMLTRFCDLER